LAMDSVADQLMIAHVYNVDVRDLLPRVNVPIPIAIAATIERSGPFWSWPRF
jgi:hypothetical protein